MRKGNRWSAACCVAAAFVSTTAAAVVDIKSTNILPALTAIPPTPALLSLTTLPNASAIPTIVTPAPAPHLIVAPIKHAQRKNTLIVVLGGTNSLPTGYRQFAVHFAEKGYPVIVLSYQNAIPATVCGNEDLCYTKFHYESVFGVDLADALTDLNLGSIGLLITKADSIVGRLASIIDYLSYHYTILEPNPDVPNKPYDRGWWKQFMGSGAYQTANQANVEPNWDQIVVVGHSQGGGHAAYLGFHAPVQRTVLFAAPNDQVGWLEDLDVLNNRPASWITEGDASNFWGMRHANDTLLGPNVPDNWASMYGGPVRDGQGNAVLDGIEDNVFSGRWLQMNTMPVPNTLPTSAHNCPVANDPSNISLSDLLPSLNNVALDLTCGAVRRKAWDHLLGLP